VRDTRDASTNYLRIAVWDVLIDAGLCRKCTGVPGMPGVVNAWLTYYGVTAKLLNIVKEYRQGYANNKLRRNTVLQKPVQDALVTLHSGKKYGSKPLPLTGFHPSILRLIKHDEDRLAIIASKLTNHSWWNPFPSGARIPYSPNPVLRFTHSEELNRYCRLAGFSKQSIQNLSPEKRRILLIDNESVMEWDFKSFDIRRCYHYHGIDPGPDDTYRPELILPKFWDSRLATKRRNRKIVRDFIKTTTNICLNTASQRQATKAVAQLLRDHNSRDFLYRIFFKYEEMDLPAAELVQRIVAIHSAVVGDFFHNIGEIQMTLAAYMMLDIVWELVGVQESDIPCYAIHDSVLCKRSDQDIVYNTMEKWYYRYHGERFYAVIEPKY
jgi:hypothetical protein